jgi:hypothetical protein
LNLSCVSRTALRLASGLIAGGSSSALGIRASCTSTGITSLFRLSADSISMRTKSSGFVEAANAVLVSGVEPALADDGEQHVGLCHLLV